MPRTCFVIMPFSATTLCTEDEWTWIFEKVFKPAVEGAGLDYECRRSVATRGNIVASILQELSDTYVVIADLTDRNANVFYELGVRHTLKDRTILVAQKKEDIPFDLLAYAYHVYDWKTDKGRAELAEKLAQLLSEIDANPERPDNPVSDFLGRTLKPATTSPPVIVTSQEVTYAQSLAGSSAEGLDAIVFARKLAQLALPQAMNTVFRLTRAELNPLMKERVDTLNQRSVPDSIQQNQILDFAKGYISEVEPLIQKVEQFAMASIEEGWLGGAQIGLKFAGDWISLSERRSDGRVIRFAQGVPAFLGWRLLILSGAKALADEVFNLLGYILREPIEVEDISGRFTNRSLLQRRDLFYPDSFLGHANYPMKYMAQLWKDIPHLHGCFTSEEDYQFSVAKFLMVVALAVPPDSRGYPLYPGYRLLPQAQRAMSSLCSKLAASEPYLEGIAKAIGETGIGLRQSWPERVRLANSVELGSLYHGGVRFPDPMDAEIPEY
jgi:hypothetical protein